jgi:hypothetical protein
MIGLLNEREAPMRWWLVFTLTVSLLLVIAGCAGEGNSPETTLVPYLYQETLEISPNPADLDTDVVFLMGWKDHDGDLTEGFVTVRLVNDFDEARIIPIKNVKFEGKTSGVLSFEVTIRDGYQGTYYIIAADKKGHLSDEISQYLFVNAPHPTDDDADN